MNHRERLDDLLSLARHVKPVAGARVAALLDVNGYLFHGTNSRKTHPFQAQWGKNPLAICLHAEIDAIKKAVKRLHPSYLERNHSVLYVARAKADGSPGLAKPCEGCQRAIAAFGINEVYWTE